MEAFVAPLTVSEGANRVLVLDLGNPGPHSSVRPFTFWVVNLTKICKYVAYCR